ncbi:endonuclease domain-containing protein [Nocardioidaceae bacterium]|nr:endonuclease domain-containing protein [Nocardioidaceae bacterium]
MVPAAEAAVHEVVRLVDTGHPREAVVAVDMTAAAGLCTVEDMRRLVDGRRRMPTRFEVQRVLALADGASESPPETRLRLLWVLDSELPEPVVNRWVHDRDGRPLAVPDLLEPESGLVVEYDGGAHAEVGRRTRDAEKDDLYREVGLEPVRFTAVDMRTPARVLHRLARGHARARAWVRPRGWVLGPSFRGAPVSPSGRVA